MRHVRVTSRGRSREHRVLLVTCPVTRSCRSISPLASPAPPAPRSLLSRPLLPFRIRTYAYTDRLSRAGRLCSKCMITPVILLLPPPPTSHKRLKVALYDCLLTFGFANRVVFRDLAIPACFSSYTSDSAKKKLSRCRIVLCASNTCTHTHRRL